MGGSFKKTLSKSPVQTIGMRLIQGDNIWRAVTQNAGTPAQRGLHQWINKQYKSATSGGGGGGSDSGGSQYDPAMMMYFSNMQSQQAAQARAAEEAQRQALSESQEQAAIAATKQAEVDSLQQLSQAEGMQQAKDISALQQQKKSYGSAGQSAIGDGYDINKAKQEQLYNISQSDSIKKPSTMKTANIFNMPRSSDIKFGGQ